MAIHSKERVMFILNTFKLSLKLEKNRRSKLFRFELTYFHLNSEKVNFHEP